MKIFADLKKKIIFTNGYFYRFPTMDYIFLSEKVDQIWMGKIKVSVCTLSLIFTRACLHALTNDISPFAIIFFMETFTVKKIDLMPNI